MPRPYIAIYEMLRVAKKAVFFIEPKDTSIDWWPPNTGEFFNREIIKNDITGSSISYKNSSGNELASVHLDWYEEGAFNYVYTLSMREIQKISQGMGIPSFASKGFNDYYDSNYSNQSAEKGVAGFDETKKEINFRDNACKKTGIPESYIIGMLFKETPSPQIIDLLIKNGFNFTYTRTRYIPIKWPNIN
jgi:hypothetical protein